MYGVLFDDVAVLLQQRAKALIGRGLLSIDPDNQDSSWAKKLADPVQRHLKVMKRAPAPINQRDVVLACRTAAISGRTARA